MSWEAYLRCLIALFCRCSLRQWSDFSIEGPCGALFPCIFCFLHGGAIFRSRFCFLIPLVCLSSSQLCSAPSTHTVTVEMVPSILSIQPTEGNTWATGVFFALKIRHLGSWRESSTVQENKPETSKMKSRHLVLLFFPPVCTLHICQCAFTTRSPVCSLLHNKYTTNTSFPGNPEDMVQSPIQTCYPNRLPQKHTLIPVLDCCKMVPCGNNLDTTLRRINFLKRYE